MKEKVKLAKKLSKTFHTGQKYGTEDYFKYHIKGVVKSLKLHDMAPKFIIVGYLHDIVEDTELNLEVIDHMFGKEIADAVDAMTKRKDETREDYLIRCAKNKIAKFVKLHDAMFNASNCFKNKNKGKYAYYLQTMSTLN